MTPPPVSGVKVLFASGSDEVAAQTLREFSNVFPDAPLVVVSEFAPPSAEPKGCEWIPFHIRRTFAENRALIQSRLEGRPIRVAAIILEPQTPHWPMRFLAMTLAPWKLLAYSETGQHFRLRPDNLPVMLRHLLWRAKNLVRSQTRKGGWLHDTWELLHHPEDLRLLALYWAARLRPWVSKAPVMPSPWPAREFAPGISVVIPSRNGRELLETCLPLIADADEIVVVDNGSDDGTAEFLQQRYPALTVEQNAQPLSFADAVNRGLRRARFSHVCLLNNDMQVEPGFLAALRKAFDEVPGLFSGSAQIFLPPGQRREETGKTVWAGDRAAAEFPVSCDVPIAGSDQRCGEDQSYVLYGSGGCTLYDAAKVAALGGFDPGYKIAYVEDLDIGMRAWRQGWPSVYCAQARVLHQHRTTTSRYFTPEQLDAVLETNFVRFLARFGLVWRENLQRLHSQRPVSQAKRDALSLAARIPVSATLQPETVLPLVSGDVAVFRGKPRSGRPIILIASPYLPFPLSHGAAVRIYNLMRRAAADFDLVLLSFVEEPAPVPVQLTEMCVEVVTVRRPGTHALPSTARPDTVEEFDSPVFHAALRQTLAKWNPRVVQFEFTQMAQYAADCKPAKTILVEHDITFDLYEQMLRRGPDWETQRQYARWLQFEKDAWHRVDRVVTMSEKDRKAIAGSVAIPNGVDLDRFQPSTVEPEPRRLLFIGSFAHPPNVLALEFFLRDVFPKLPDVTLHVIAGQRHERFWDLRHDNVEVEGFVSDVRPAYERASVVVAPLIASAGTNIKILEAMAMGKAIVSTEAGINGIDLERGADAVVADGPEEMALAIARLLRSPEERRALEQHARRTAEQRYGWDAIAVEQKRLYRNLL